MNISQEVLAFPSGILYKKIAGMAKVHYKPEGQNSWHHIQQVYSQAARCLRFVEKRDMTPVEFAAIVYHDSSVMLQDKDRHNEFSALIAKKELATIFTDEELETIGTAILEHDNNPEHVFTSSVGDLLATGDFNPPDVEWVLNKSYTWGIKHGLSHEQRLQNTVRTMPEHYGTHGTKAYFPKYYYAYFHDRIKAFQKSMDHLTYKKAEEIILAYRQRNGLKDNDITLPDPSVEGMDAFLSAHLEYSTESFDLYKDEDRKIALDVIKSYIDDAADPDTEAERILEYYVARTKYHIRKVVQFSRALADRIDDGHLARVLLETCVHHDRDKLDDPRYIGMYAPMQMKRYAPQLAEGYALAPGYDVFWDHSVVTKHCLLNDHHPEKYAVGYKDDSENNPPYDVTSMPDDALIQTIADWMAVSFEKGMKARGYYQGPASKRYIFSDHQKAFIEKCLQHEDECQAEVSKTEKHFKTLEEAEAYVKEHWNGHRKFYDETTKRLISTCRCSSRIHDKIPDCFIEDGLYQMHKREQEAEKAWERRISGDDPAEQASSEGFVNELKKAFKGRRTFHNLFDFGTMQAATRRYMSEPASYTAYRKKVSAVGIYEKIREDVLDYWDKETDHAIKFAAENRYQNELVGKMEDYRFHPPTVKRTDVTLSEYGYKSRFGYVKKRLSEIAKWKTFYHRSGYASGYGSEYAEELKHLDKIPDKRYVPYVKKVLERWLAEAKEMVKANLDKVDFFYKEYEEELRNLNTQKPSSEAFDISVESMESLYNGRELSVHKCTDSEVRSHIQLITECDAQAAEASGDPDRYTDKEMLDAIKKNNASVYFFQKGSTKIGCAVYSVQGDKEKQAAIHTTGLLKAYQNKGYGRVLLRKLCTAIFHENADVKSIVLSVAKGNDRAKHVYETIGFQDTNEKRSDGSTAMILTRSTSDASTEALGPHTYDKMMWANNPVKRQIRSLASPYYDRVGSHGWNHINEVLACAYVLKKQQDLDNLEYTAIVLHDIARKKMDKGHNIESEKMARQILPGTKLFTPDECDAIYTAILEHSGSYRKEKGIEYSSKLSELVGEADKGFPATSLEALCIRPLHWIMEGSDRGTPAEREYNYYRTDEDIARRILERIHTYFDGQYEKSLQRKSLWDVTFTKELKLRDDLVKAITFDDVLDFVKSHQGSWSEESLSVTVSMEDYTDVFNQAFFDRYKKTVRTLDETHYRITDFPLRAFAKRVFKEYRSHRPIQILQAMGLKILHGFRRTADVAIHRFFVPELLYLLEKFEYSVNLRNAIVEGTWVSQTPQTTTSVDINRIKANMKCTLLDYQQEFINSYAENKDSNHLRGYLLSFEQGLGKTLTSLALMEAMSKDVVIILCPKNTMLETWKAHLDTFFKDKQYVYVAGITQAYNGERWCIINYDAMPKLDTILPKLKKSKVGLIVDESHNFLRVAADRTKSLMQLVQNPILEPTLDVLLMSGTPIKAFGVEMIPLLHILDPLFDDEAEATFRAAFGLNTALSADILHNRLIRMMTRVTKVVLNLPEKNEYTVKVKMPTGEKYTVDAVKKALMVFVEERIKYHEQLLPTYQAEWKECIDWLDKKFAGNKDYAFWKNRVDQLIEDNGVFPYNDPTIPKMNLIEVTVLEPAMPKDLLKKFRHCKAAIKYLRLKIKGEALGMCLGRLRMSMTSELLKASPIIDLINDAEKKTIIFTSFVDTVELAETYCKEHGLTPITIYGKTSNELADLVKKFQTEPVYNPLIASIQTLATGATLTAANRVIFLNKPWRGTDYQQASDRVHRIGQDAKVDIISLVLDTGEKGNLSTRMEEVMDMSNDLFGRVVDGNIPADVEAETVHAMSEALWNHPDIPDIVTKDTLLSMERSDDVVWTESMIRSPEDLMAFYQDCSYGTVVNGTKYTGRQLTAKVIDQIRILSPEKQFRNKTGTCYETAGLTAYFLNRWNIPYRMYFANERKDYDKEQGIWNDRTHLFVIYQNDDKKWVWLEGSWGPHKGLHKPWDSADALVHDIMDRLKASNGNKMFCREIHKYPGFNLSIHVFYGMLVSNGQIRFSTEALSQTEVNTDDLDVSTESLEGYIPSAEAAASDKKALRKKIEDYIVNSIKLMERTTTVNEEYWRDRFASMSDADFDKFMHCLKDGTENIHMYVPPLKVRLRNADLIDAAHKLGVKLMHRIWMTDESTGLTYLTPEEYLVIKIPVRRQQQFYDEKVSVPEDDKHIDGMTGQVTGDSKACAITNPEIHILQARNLDASLYEYANVRGGNIANYAKFKAALEETGTVSLASLDGSSRTRVAVVAGILLKGMHLDSNFNPEL